MADFERSDADYERSAADGAADAAGDVALGFGIAAFMIVAALITTIISQIV
jgi:hypothetical protein